MRRDLQQIQKKVIPLLKQYHIKRAGIFGSYARGEYKKTSDIDILVQPAKGMGLKFVEMNFALEKVLRKKVDLVTYNGINPHLKDRILKDEVRIL